MSDSPSVLLEACSEVARLAGDIALSHFWSGITVESKADGSPVTIADRSAEMAARDWIAAKFPDDGIVGEEFGELNPGAARRWIIDPIDGTKSFVRGVPLWGTLVAVCEGEDVVAGAAFFPPVNEMLAAARGEGCWWNGVRAAVSEVDSLDRALICTTDEQFHVAPQRVDAWRHLASKAGLVRGWGDCYGYLLVATGRAEVMMDGIVSPWDVAALHCCVVEAGGAFTDWSGRSTAFGGSAIATNAKLAKVVRETLSERSV